MKRRKEVELFADAMERKLKKNDFKGGWSNESYPSLEERLYEELDEFVTASRKGNNRMLNEGADVANFIMMICDIRGRLNKEDS